MIYSHYNNSHPPYDKGDRPADLIHRRILDLQHKAETDDVKTYAPYPASTGYRANQQDLAPEKQTVEGEAEKPYECNVVRESVRRNLAEEWKKGRNTNLTFKENIGETTVNANKLTIKDEYASLVPPISEPEYQSIKQSIKDDKQHLPIIVNPQRIILDGHNRFKACDELEIDPLITIRKFEGPLQEKKFIIEVNRNRRHLNEFQRIELESKYETIERELAKKRMSEAGKRGAEKRWKEEREKDVPK